MVAVARLFLSRFRSPWTSPCRRERMRGRERRAAASSASSVSRGDPDAAAPWSASTSTASIRPQQEGLEPRSASSIGTRHLGRRRRRRGEEGSSSRHLGRRRRLDSMSWPRWFTPRKQPTVQGGGWTGKRMDISFMPRIQPPWPVPARAAPRLSRCWQRQSPSPFFCSRPQLSTCSS